MKIMVVGDWHSELHEEAVSNAFESLGHVIIRFPWHHYFKINNSGLFKPLQCFKSRIQNKLVTGSIISKINKDFIVLALNTIPDAIFIYRGTHIKAETLRLLKNELPSTVLIGYNNDDPFSKAQSKLLWQHFLKAVPLYDLILAYRHHNLDDFRKAGAQRVELLRSWFIPERNRPVNLTIVDNERFGCDVVFVGHYEPDDRLEFLEILSESGYKVRLFGPGYEWDSILKKSKKLCSLLPIHLVWGDDYNKALCGAKIALCFFSKLNRDTYTRRCFEIPATGTLLMSEHSEDLSTLYEEDKEAVFFRSKSELLEKVQKYLKDDILRKSIAKAGHEKVYKAGYDVVSRMKDVIRQVEKIRDGSRNNNERNALYN